MSLWFSWTEYKDTAKAGEVTFTDSVLMTLAELLNVKYEEHQHLQSVEGKRPCSRAKSF